MKYKLAGIVVKDRIVAQLLSDIANGKDPWIAVIERVGVDGITDLMNDPEKKIAYEEANRKYAERVAKEKDYAEATFAEKIKLLEQMIKRYLHKTTSK